MPGCHLRSKSPLVVSSGNLLGRSHLLGVCLLGWLLSWSPVAAQPPRFAALIEEARASFRPVTEDHVAQAVAKVRQSLQAVEEYVGTDAQIAEAWRRYLGWDEQVDRLNRNGGPDSGFWKRIYRSVARNEAGFEHTSFQQYRQAVRALSQVMDTARSPAQAAELEATLDQLSPLLQSPRAMLEPDRVDQISLLLGDLARQQQAEALRSALRQHYHHPNVVLKVPASLLERMPSEPIELGFPIRDCIGGAAVRGVGHMSATQSLSFVPNTSRLELRMAVSGTSHSRTTGTKDRVRVYTTGVLPFVSTSEIFLDNHGLALASFNTDARLKTRITRVSADYWLPFRRNAGVRQAYARQHSDRRAAQRDAIAELNSTFDQQLASTIGQLEKDYREQIYHPLVRLDRVPDQVQFRTESDMATMELLLADPTQLGVGYPSERSGDSECLRCYIHQSAFNNSATVLSDRTEALDVALRRLLVGGNGAIDRQPDPVWITFDDRKPLRVTFHDDEMTLALAGKSYVYRRQRYSGMDIQLRYRLKASGPTPEFVLSGSPEVLLPLDPNGKRPRSGLRSITLRRILTNVLERDVPKSIRLDDLSLPEPSNSLWKFAVEQMTINDGWLTLDAQPVAPQDEIPLQ